jgi:protein-S-isoprenylcysteine O-methyltransferase Ste14
MKRIMISIGNFLFKYRNFLFPLYILALFLLFSPPANQINGSKSAQLIQDLVAILIALSGLAVRGIVIGLAYIKRGGLNKKVYAANLVTEGMFSVCRNPLYVGNMLIYAGQFLMFGNHPCFAIGVLSFWFIYECIIAAEENYLRNKFGPAYDEYCRDVPRWMPKLSKLGEATTGMKFDWKKVIFKDYSTMAMESPGQPGIRATPRGSLWLGGCGDRHLPGRARGPHGQEVRASHRHGSVGRDEVRVARTCRLISN